MRRGVELRNLSRRVEVERGACFGRCRVGPNCRVEEIAQMEQRFAFATFPTARDGTAAMYNRVTVSDVDEIITEHILGGRTVRRLVVDPKSDLDEVEPSRQASVDCDGE